MAQPENVFIAWHISCFDKRREKPLPVYGRQYIMDEGKATDQEKQTILRIIHANDVPEPEMGNEIGETMVTLSHGMGGCSRRVLRYRHLFLECTIADISTLLNNGIKMESVSLADEYFEDETGREISVVEMMDHVAGGGPVIISGVPESIIRLGPAGMREPESWSVDTANTLAQFFEVVDHICASSWCRAPLAVSSLDGVGVLSSAFPSVDSAFGILVLFRQLYSSDPQDDLFNRACGAYLRHVDNRWKAIWVRDEKSQFNTLLSGRPFLSKEEVPFTLRELLDVFLYGAGLIHARGKDREDQDKLLEAVKRCPRETLVFSFHSGMKTLFGCALTVYPVLWQDYLHWTGALGAQKPDRLGIAALLGSSARGAKRDSSEPLV